MNLQLSLSGLSLIYISNLKFADQLMPSRGMLYFAKFELKRKTFWLYLDLCSELAKLTRLFPLMDILLLHQLLIVSFDVKSYTLFYLINVINKFISLSSCVGIQFSSSFSVTLVVHGENMPKGQKVLDEKLTVTCAKAEENY